MMGNKHLQTNGGDIDVLTRAKRHYRYRPKTRQWFKRHWWKRIRADLRARLGREDEA